MAIYSAQPCWEIDNTAQSNIGLNGSGASVTLGCPYDQRFIVAQDILQNRRAFPGYGGTGAPLASDIQLSGWGEQQVQAGSNDQILDYEEARLDVTYEPMAADVPEDPDAAGYDLIIESLSGQVDGKRLGHELFVWGSATGTPIDPGESPVVQVRRMQVEREFIGMAALPLDIYGLIGKCNKEQWVSTLLNFTFPPETLLFNYPLASRTIRTNGNSGWNVKMSLSYKEEGWNKFWRVTGNNGVGAYDEMYTGEGQTPYKNYPPETMTGILF